MLERIVAVYKRHWDFSKAEVLQDLKRLGYGTVSEGPLGKLIGVSHVKLEYCEC